MYVYISKSKTEIRSSVERFFFSKVMVWITEDHCPRVSSKPTACLLQPNSSLWAQHSPVTPSPEGGL